MPYRKISSCPQDFVNIIYKLAEQFQFENIEYVVEFGSDDIDCFLNDLYRVKMKGLRNGHKLKRSIFIKWHPDQDIRYCFRESYIREFIFYRHIVPKFVEIQNEFKIIEGLKIKLPKCVLASIEINHEIIAVLGLEEHGYAFHNRFYKKDLNHVVLTMKYLGKFHALSFIFANKYPKEFEEVVGMMQKDVQYSDPDKVSKFVRCYYDASVSVVSDLAAKEKLKKLGSDILSILNKSTQPVPLYSTFCHGDLIIYSINLLFRDLKNGFLQNFFTKRKLKVNNP
ncbi:hypothetical protein K1T71_007779 [Dendrolimus kikuchii]|uniref:Uncharacterized protein n=1 Tax=Dendrolimus kikuchii TaxID=765133 RepID=A0ACC1CYP1_9NEOP|nr:hypothetical protein K1T71_007779 [Dendrolimus kikuchii]